MREEDTIGPLRWGRLPSGSGADVCCQLPNRLTDSHTSCHCFQYLA